VARGKPGKAKPRGRTSPAPSRTKVKSPRGNKPSWIGKPILGPFDRPLAQQSEFAYAYTRKWHAIADWALENVPGDVRLRNGDPRRRTAKGLLVRDVDDSEEAAERGIPMERMRIADGPSKEQGGRRRVTIRLLTWLWDVRQHDAYQPQWGQFGTGLTALQASRAFNRYMREYQDAVTKGIESRRLIVTGMSVVWWTSDPRELNYV